MGDDLGMTCDEARQHAEEIAAAPFGSTAADHRSALVRAVERHLVAAEHRLSTAAKRVFLHDHRRVAQLLRALELALDAHDRRAALAARRLGEFIGDHAARERSYVDAGRQTG